MIRGQNLYNEVKNCTHAHTHIHTHMHASSPFLRHANLTYRLQITATKKPHTNCVSFACIMRAHVSAIQLRAISANTNLTLPCGQHIHLVMHRDKNCTVSTLRAAADVSAEALKRDLIRYTHTLNIQSHLWPFEKCFFFPFSPLSTWTKHDGRRWWLPAYIQRSVFVKRARNGDVVLEEKFKLRIVMFTVLMRE